MEEFIKDKIFQFYYKKIYGQKSNYQSFKTFPDKEKVSFLINLYLYISNINNNVNSNIEYINFNLNNNIKSSKEKELINKEKNDNDSFYRDNYNNIMNKFNDILNKYNNKIKENNKNNENNTINNINDNKIQNPNDNKILINNNNKIIDKNQTNSFKENNNNLLKSSAYMKYNYNYESNSKFINDEDNYFEEKQNINEKEIIITSKKNDIDTTINKPPLKPGSPLCIINSNKNNKNYKINTLLSTQHINYNNQNSPKKIISINNQSINLNNNNDIEKENIENKDINRNENFLLNKSCPNLNESNSLNNSNDKLLIKDLIVINQTITDKSRTNLELEEFKNENIVEKLIKCPQNKYISLNCSEANKLALVIINLMETKNDLENEIEEERKKNEIRLNKLKLDFDRQKRNIKSNYDKREINILETLNQMKNEIDNEKRFLDDNLKSYNLWDQVTIENQKTKEIRENIIKKLETLKK